MESATQATWGVASQQSNQSAINHFNVFLRERYCKFAGKNQVKKLFGLEDSGQDKDFSVENCTMQTIIANNNIELVDVAILNFFAYYLAVHAGSLDGKREPLSYNSAMRYLSSIKQLVVRALINKPVQSLLPKDKMALVYGGLLKLYVQRHKKSRTPMVKSHYTATRREIMAIMMMCLWLDEPRFTTFAVFLLSLIQFAARATECSVFTFDCLKMSSPDEFDNHQEKIAELSMMRDKTYQEQSLPVFNDRDSFFTDWYFMLFLSMMSNTAKPEIFRSMNNQATTKATTPVSDDDDDDVFGTAVNLESIDVDEDDHSLNANPNAGLGTGIEDDEEEEEEDNNDQPAPKRRRKSKQSTKESTASAQFGKLVKLISEMGKSLVERFGVLDGGDDELPDNVKTYLNDVVDGKLEVNSRFTSHSGKRHGVNLAHNSPYIKTSWVLICSGWIVKGLHTLFDYVDFSSSSARHVARARNGWTAPLHGSQEGLEGGRPAMLNALETLVHSNGMSAFCCRACGGL